MAASIGAVTIAAGSFLAGVIPAAAESTTESSSSENSTPTSGQSENHNAPGAEIVIDTFGLDFSKLVDQEKLRRDKEQMFRDYQTAVQAGIAAGSGSD